MPPVLATGPTIMQNLLFFSLAVAVTIASIHFPYPRRDGQAELAEWISDQRLGCLNHRVLDL